MKRKLKSFCFLMAALVAVSFAFKYPISNSYAADADVISWEVSHLEDFQIKEIARTSSGYQITVNSYKGSNSNILIDDSFFTAAKISDAIKVNNITYEVSDLLSKNNTVVFDANSLTNVRYLHIKQSAPVLSLKSSCFGSYSVDAVPTIICENRNVAFGNIGAGAVVYAYTYSEDALKSGETAINANTKFTSAYTNADYYTFYQLPEIMPGDITLTYSGKDFCESDVIYKYCTSLCGNLNNKATAIASTASGDSVLENYNYTVSCNNSSTGTVINAGTYNMVATASFKLDADNKVDLMQEYKLTINPIDVEITPYVSPSQSTDGKIDASAGIIYGSSDKDADISYVKDKNYDGTDVADSNVNHFTFTFGDAQSRLDDSVLTALKGTLADTFTVKAAYADENVGEKDIIFTIESKSKNFNVKSTKAIKGTIKAAPLVIEDLRVVNKTYDGSTKATLGGTVKGVADKDNFNLTEIPAYFSDANVGTNKVVSIDTENFASLMEKKYPNYSLELSDNNLVGSISAKTLTATVEPVQIYAGSEIPDLDVTVSGFVTGESAASLAGFVYPTASTTATNTSGVGNYPITVSGGAPTANYVFEYVPGTLNIADLGDLAAYSLYDTYVQNATSTAVSINSLMYNGTLVEADSYGWTVGKKDINFYKNGKANAGATFTAVSSKQWYTLYAKLGSNIIYKYEQFPVLSDAEEPADNVAPTLTIKKSTTKATKGNVKVSVIAADNKGIKSISVNGVAYNKSALTITVKKNKTLKIVAEDTSGNKTAKTVKIKNIDKVKPSIVAKVTPTKSVKVTVSDNKTKAKKLSVRYIKGYKTAKNWKSAKATKSFKAKKKQVYTILCRDAVGNVKAYHFKVTRTCKVKIIKK